MTAIIDTTKKTTGRKCSICTHAQLEEINAEIFRGVSLRAISRQFCVEDKSRDSLNRHSVNCLNIDLRAVIAVVNQERQKTAKINIVNVYEEFSENLLFVKDLRDRAKVYVETNPQDYTGAFKCAIEAMKGCDLAIDKFAKMGGLYAADKLNPEDAAKLLEAEREKFQRMIIALADKVEADKIESAQLVSFIRQFAGKVKLLEE